MQASLSTPANFVESAWNETAIMNIEPKGLQNVPSSSRIEGRKLLEEDPGRHSQSVRFRWVQLPRANSGSCRMRERLYIDRSQSNIYPFTTIYIDGGGPRQLNTKTHSTAFKKKKSDRG
ncbi:unnamed protein product [Onchocerca ochengi]|uniref:Uncharacterized protein n=1 Tax=Onchocerca ochengi TaxID=42157 RepID=A0A182E5M2_ONCOC|nr:unnamed protein product [Onchocerca ochengi]